MDIKELRQKTAAELRTSLHDLLQEQFNLRMQKGSGQSPRPHMIKQLRKDIARLKTVMTEKQRAGE